MPGPGDGGRPDDGRDESPAQRADRNWNELLQEFRVLQTGVQILSGFLLTLPFQRRFTELDRFQETLYLALVVVAAVTTSVLLSPIAVHRQAFRQQRKELIVTTGHRLARVIIVLIGLLVTGVTIFVFDVVVDRTAGLLVGGFMVVVVLASVAGLPARIARG